MALLLSRRAAIARALAQAGERGVSGETLAHELGVSRVAIGKHVTALRALGYEIESLPRVGYRLLGAPDACIPEEVGPLLADPLWVACEGADALGSTNDEAKRLARAGVPEGTAVVAARQTAGRGRFGRVWESPPGGAYVSCVLRPPLAPVALGGLSLALAVGTARALDSLGAEAGLKWPNDLEVAGRKLGGILLEMTAEADRTEWVVAGCGVNVVGAPGADFAAVREQVPDVRVPVVAAALLDGIAAAYREFLGAGFPGGLAAAYRARDVLTGRDVIVRDATGALVAAGVAERVADDGSLVVAGQDGTRSVAAGEVTLRSAAR